MITDTGRTETPPAPQEQQSSGAERSPQEDRRAHRHTLQAFRPRRVIPATIVSALLAIVAILVAIEVIAQLFGGSLLLPTEQLGQLGQDTAWNDPLPITVAIIVGLLGLLLLVLAFLPGRPRLVPLVSHRPAVWTVMTRGGVRGQAEHAAESVAGVTRARAKLSRHQKLTVRVDTPLRDPGDLGEQVHQAVAGRLGQLEPLRATRPRVSVRFKEE